MATFKTPSLPPGGTSLFFGSKQIFDAFVFSDGTVKKGFGAFGYQVLNPAGSLMTEGFSRMTYGTRDSTTAEFEGLIAALTAAHTSGARAVWVGIDSFEAILHTAKESDRYKTLLDRLHEVLKNLEFVCVQAIARKDNKWADHLARKGIAHIR